MVFLLIEISFLFIVLSNLFLVIIVSSKSCLLKSLKYINLINNISTLKLGLVTISSSSIAFIVNCQNKITSFSSINFEILLMSLNSLSFKEKLDPSKLIEEIFLIKYNISKKSFKNTFGSTPV